MAPMRRSTFKHDREPHRVPVWIHTARKGRSLSSPPSNTHKTPPGTALVTGSGKRLGHAIAIALAEDGFDLALHYHQSEDEAIELSDQIETMGRRAYAIKADLAEPGRMAALLDDVLTALGPVSLLVNSASLFAKDSLSTMTLESWRRFIDVNLSSQVFLMKAFAGQPELPPHSSIINMLDQQMSAPSPLFFSYAVAKIGFEGATKLAAFELAPDVRVNGIAPGLVLRSGKQTDASFIQYQQKMPLGEGLGTADIVKAVRYLIAANHVTGQILNVDSGQSLIGPANSRLSP